MRDLFWVFLMLVPCAAFVLPPPPTRAPYVAPVRARMAAPGADAGCDLIGEEVATATTWFSCDGELGVATAGGPIEITADAKSGAACKEEDFGVGGGPGILPQEGEVLCKVERPQDQGQEEGKTVPNNFVDKFRTRWAAE